MRALFNECRPSVSGSASLWLMVSSGGVRKQSSGLHVTHAAFDICASLIPYLLSH